MKREKKKNTCYLHAFFIKIAARQQKQVQEHNALYHSINSYSEEIAGIVKDLSPLGVLKTAILLHQRQPREGTNDPTMQKACSAPYQGKRKYERSCSTDIRLGYK